MKKNRILSLLIVMTLVLAGCNLPGRTPTPSASPSPSATIAPIIPSPTETNQPSPSPTPLPTHTPVTSQTPSPTPPVYRAPNTPLPSSLNEINYMNAGLVTRLAEWQVESVSDLTWSTDSRMLAVAGHNQITVYDVQTRNQVALIPTRGGITSISFSPRGNYLVAGYSFGNEETGQAGGIDYWRTSDWQRVGALYDNEQPVAQISFSPKGDSFAAALTGPVYEQNEVLFWDTFTWEITPTLHTGGALAIAFSPDSLQFATSPDRYSLKIWDVEKIKEIQLVNQIYTTFTGAISSMAYAPNSAIIATGTYEGEIGLWDAAKGALIRILQNGGVVESVSFSRDSSVLASGESFTDSAVRLWDVETGLILNTLRGFANGVQKIAFAPNGQILASASYDGTIILWGIRP